MHYFVFLPFSKSSLLRSLLLQHEQTQCVGRCVSNWKRRFVTETKVGREMVLKICVGVRTAPVARLVTLGSVWFGLSRCTSCSMISLDSSSTLVRLSNCTVLIVVTLLLFVTSIDIDLFPLFLFRFFFCYFTYHTCFVLFTAFYSLVLVLLFMFPHSLFHYCSYLLTVC